jgi:nucleoid-associated protein EbfC
MVLIFSEKMGLRRGAGFRPGTCRNDKGGISCFVVTHRVMKVREENMTKGFNPMQQIKTLQDKMAKIQEELAAKTVESSAGGGMVTAVMNGRQELVSLKLEPQVVDPQDLEMLQDLIVAAVNDALRRSQEMAAGEMGKLAGGLNIPGLKLPGLF